MVIHKGILYPLFSKSKGKSEKPESLNGLDGFRLKLSAEFEYDKGSDSSTTEERSGNPEAPETPPRTSSESVRRILDTGVLAVPFSIQDQREHHSSGGAVTMSSIPSSKKTPFTPSKIPLTPSSKLQTVESSVHTSTNCNHAAKFRDGSSDRKCMEAMRALEQDGDLDACMKSLEDVLSTEPDHYFSSESKIFVTAMKGDLPLAKELAMGLVAKHSTEARAYQAYGNLLWRYLGDVEKAIEYFKKATLIRPKYLSALFCHAAALHHVGKVNESEYLYTKALNIDHRSCHAWCNLGVLAAGREDNGSAEHCFVTALGYDPAHETALYNYGLLLRTQGKIQQAEELFYRCLKSNPNHEGALKHLQLLVALRAQPRGQTSALPSGPTSIDSGSATSETTRSIVSMPDLEGKA